MFGQWDKFTHSVEPSIEYLELYAVTITVILSIRKFENQRITLFCDIMSVVHMINNMSSSCKNCMVLIRHITLEGLIRIVRVFAKHVRTDLNGPSDALSHLQFQHFWRLTSEMGKVMVEHLRQLPTEFWPIEKIWLKN